MDDLPDVDAILVTDDGDVYLTAGAAAVFELTNEEYRLRQM